MSEGRAATWEVLNKSRNRAVLPLLTCGLRSAHPVERAAAIGCIVRRRDPESHRLLIQRFDQLGDDDRRTVRNTYREHPHQLAAALKAAIVDDNAQLCANACELLAYCKDLDVLPALVQASAKPSLGNPAAIAAAIGHLTEELRARLHDRPADCETHGRDVAFALRNVLVAFERTIALPNVHNRRALLEAYLQLTPSQDSALAKMLRDTRHPCHAELSDVFMTTTIQGVLDTLVDLLSDGDAPQVVLTAIARRTDHAFLNVLLHRLKHPVPIRVLHNLQQLRSIDWLDIGQTKVLDLDGRAQALAVELAAASRVPTEVLFEFLALVLSQGLTEGRRASCAALARIKTEAANQLVRNALADPDAAVQVAAIRQLRRRGFPDALQTLVALLDTDIVEIRDAARSQLAEFNFMRFRAMFDVLDDVSAHTTGRLVHKVDPAACQELMEDLASPSLSVRMRAIDMAIAMSASDDVCEQLIELAQGENLSLRQAAVTALGKCTRPPAVDALRLAVHDPHPVVRDAALRSLERLHDTLEPAAVAVGKEE